MRIKYKCQFIATNSIVYSIFLAIASLYLVPSESKVIITLLRSISLTVISIVNFVVVMLMLYYGFKIRHVLKRQWLIQQQEQQAKIQQNHLIASIEEDYQTDGSSISNSNSFSNNNYYSVAQNNNYYYSSKSSSNLYARRNSLHSPSVSPIVNHLYHSSSEEDLQASITASMRVQAANQTENVSIKERNHVLKWMLMLTIFLFLSSAFQFILSIVFVMVNLFDVNVRLIGWVFCELVPLYLILFFFWKRSNRERIMAVFFSVQYGTLLNQS